MSAKFTDSCPNCLEREIEPAKERRRGQTSLHGYECPCCHQQWVTARLDSAYRNQTRKAA